VERDSNFVCGKIFPDREISNLELKTAFQSGEILESKNGDTRYEMIGVSENFNGTLEGQFYIILDYLGGAKVLCDFWNTKINTDNVIIETNYKSHKLPGYVVKPEEVKEYVKNIWLDANNVSTSTKIQDTIVIPEKFDYLYADENRDLIAVNIDENGDFTETKLDIYKSVNQCIITDGKGDSVVISKNGQVMGIKEYKATGGNKALLKEYHRKSDSLAQWQINFLPSQKQDYAFDYLGSGDHGIFATDEYYSKSGNYDFRYKSIECGKTDKVIVDFGSYPEKDSVVFKDKYGVKLKLSTGNILNFTGVNKTDTNYIYAYRGDEKIGKLSVNTYKPQTKYIELVSVNGAKIDKSITAEGLSKIFNCAVVNFKIESTHLCTTTTIRVSICEII
jgi:hypothetical protein